MNTEDLKKLLIWMSENNICSVIPFFAYQAGRDGKVPHWTDGKNLYNADELINKFKSARKR